MGSLLCPCGKLEFQLMFNRVVISLIITLNWLTACSAPDPVKENADQPCAQWQIDLIESKLITHDSQGHGPDVGSTEWFSVVERRMGIEGVHTVPSKKTRQWCEYVISKF